MGKVLLLRTCNSDLTSPAPEARGFKWPESGFIEALDWDGGKPICGGKLHGFLWGEGRAVFANWNPDAKWLVVEADESEVLEITEDGGGKHGFRRGEVVFCGDRRGATCFILANGAAGKAVIGATLLIRWFDISKSRYRIAVAEVGENGVSPNKPYRVDGGKFVEAK